MVQQPDRAVVKGCPGDLSRHHKKNRLIGMMVYFPPSVTDEIGVGMNGELW
jgi:hypothetical protein